MQHQQHQQPPRGQDSPNGGSEYGAQVPWPGPLPSLHLYPLSDSFVPKQIYLPPNTHMRIGRQTNAKSVPGERNGYFDSKVLSRTHAEVWQEDGKVFIKDVKSSNGTFVNGERLSPEATESEPYELKSEDHLEFGIDIVGEDNKTVVHHKVSSKAYIVFTQADVEASARELQAYQQAVARFAMRRGNNKPPGPNVNDLTRQIANELQKSRETAQDLHMLHSAMNDIHDTLGGGNPAPTTVSMHPSYPPPPSTQSPETAEDLASLRLQLSDTQNLISTSVSRVISLEGRLQEQEAVRREVEELRERLGMLQHQVEYTARLQEEEEEEEEGAEGGGEDDDEPAEDDDDTRSVDTVKPSSAPVRQSLYGRKGRRQAAKERSANGVRPAAEDEAALDEDDEHERGRPATPEPGSQPREAAPANGRRALDGERPSRAEQQQQQEEAHDALHAQLVQQLSDTATVLAQNSTLSARLDTLHTELDGVLLASRELQAAHTSALSTVAALETRVAELEGKVAEVEDKWSAWKDTMELTWRREREAWEAERERMKTVVKEWEEAKRRAEEEDEERTLNEEEGPDDLGWMGNGGDSGSGGDGPSSSGGASSLQDSTSEGNATIQGGNARFLGRRPLDQSGSATPNASLESKSHYSSLRHLLNPLSGGTTRSPSKGQRARGSVPSSFLPKGQDPANGPSVAASSDHPLHKASSASTIKGPSVSGRPAADGQARTGARDGQDGSSGSSVGGLDDVEEDEKELTITAPAAAAASALQSGRGQQSSPLSSTQLQGVLVVGFAVALALNYEKLAQLVKS